MSDKTKTEAPEAVRKTVEAIVLRAVSRCAREGIDLGDFYRELLTEQKGRQALSVVELIDRTFLRCAARGN